MANIITSAIDKSIDNKDNGIKNSIRLFFRKLTLEIIVR